MFAKVCRRPFDHQSTNHEITIPVTPQAHANRLAHFIWTWASPLRLAFVALHCLAGAALPLAMIKLLHPSWAVSTLRYACALRLRSAVKHHHALSSTTGVSTSHFLVLVVLSGLLLGLASAATFITQGKFIVRFPAVSQPRAFQ